MEDKELRPFRVFEDKISDLVEEIQRAFVGGEIEKEEYKSLISKFVKESTLEIRYNRKNGAGIIQR